MSHLSGASPPTWLPTARPNAPHPHHSLPSSPLSHPSSSGGVSQVPGPQQDVLLPEWSRPGKGAARGWGRRERARDPFAAVTRAPGPGNRLSSPDQGRRPTPADERWIGSPPALLRAPAPPPAVGVRGSPPLPAPRLRRHSPRWGPRLPGPSGRLRALCGRRARSRPGTPPPEKFAAGKGAGGGTGEEGRDGRGAAGREREERGAGGGTAGVEGGGKAGTWGPGAEVPGARDPLRLRRAG